MGKNKEKKTLKQESDLLEPAPAYVLTCENLQKDQLKANKEKENPMTGISMSLESSSEKPKKKQKRKYLSEQQAENDCSKEQHTDGHQENRKIKKKKKVKNKAVNRIKDTNDEDVERSVITEEPPRKKKKREKTNGVNEAKELETQSDEKSEEARTRKKKKKLKESKENLSEKREETEEVNLTVESETRSSEEPAEKKKKKKKKHKSKDKDRNSSAEQRKNVQTVFTTQETQTFPNLIHHDVKEEDEGIQMNGCAIKDSTEDYESLLKQLKEFIPDIESKEPVNVSKMIKYDLPRFKEFKQQGK